MENPTKKISFTITLAHGLIILALMIGVGAGIGIGRLLLTSGPSSGDVSRLGPQADFEQLSLDAIPINGRPFLGPADAPVTIIEFTDYQCPYCALHSRENLAKLLEQSPAQIKYVVLNFPITSIHPGADRAAQAAECAASQGRFWEYHDMLFQNQGSQNDEGLKGLARKAGLDGDTFDVCLDSGIQSQQVRKDFEEGRDHGVRATPTFFINGRIVEGYLPFNDFKSIVGQAAGE